MDAESLHKQLCATPGVSPALPLSRFAIDGPDAQEFLQGQLTLDLDKLARGRHQITAWCNAKGRVWAVLRIWRCDAGFELLLPSDQADAFARRLRMFVLRAKVTIEPLGGPVHAEIGEQASAEAGGVELGEASTVLHHDAGHRLMLGGTDHATTPAATGRYRALRILAGEPQIAADTQEKFLPQSLNLGELGGLHFNKGCYVGQEIVARVHYRGKAPQRMRWALDPTDAVLEGKAVLADVATDAGRLVQWVENIKEG